MGRIWLFCLFNLNEFSFMECTVLIKTKFHGQLWCERYIVLHLDLDLFCSFDRAVNNLYFKMGWILLLGLLSSVTSYLSYSIHHLSLKVNSAICVIMLINNICNPLLLILYYIWTILQIATQIFLKWRKRGCRLSFPSFMLSIFLLHHI